MENTAAAGSGGQIVVAGAGYAGLHVMLRLTAKLGHHPAVELTLVDRHDYHQALTELPRVAGGTRAADAVRVPLQDVLAERVRFLRTEINGFDLAGQRLLTGAGPIGWGRLVLALGSRPNDFAIPGLAQRQQDSQRRDIVLMLERRYSTLVGGRARRGDRDPEFVVLGLGGNADSHAPKCEESSN